MKTPVMDARTVLLQMELPIAAARGRVWQALVEETGAWWPRDFYMDARARSLVVEPRLGGRWFEDWGEGAGRVWYTVVGVEPGRMLELAGQLSPDFGGPAATQVQLVLAERAGGTLLRLTDSLSGRIGEETATRTEEGWRALFAGAFKTYVERR